MTSAAGAMPSASICRASSRMREALGQHQEVRLHPAGLEEVEHGQERVRPGAPRTRRPSASGPSRGRRPDRRRPSRCGSRPARPGGGRCRGRPGRRGPPPCGAPAPEPSGAAPPSTTPTAASAARTRQTPPPLDGRGALRGIGHSAAKSLARHEANARVGARTGPIPEIPFEFYGVPGPLSIWDQGRRGASPGPDPPL